MDIRLLGPVACWRADGPLPIQGRSARAVLAMLALERGRTVSTDELVEGLWGEGLPADPSAAVYVTVSRVRLGLGPDRDRLRRSGRGYMLEAGDTEVDVSRAEVALARGRSLLGADQPAGAMAVLEAGLSEWRQEAPLSELADLPFAPVAIRRLQRLHSELVETANQACLECGAPHPVLDRSERALRSDPWREQLVAQLMTAFCQLGRHGDALAAYARLASALSTAPRRYMPARVRYCSAWRTSRPARDLGAYDAVASCLSASLLVTASLRGLAASRTGMVRVSTPAR